MVLTLRFGVIFQLIYDSTLQNRTVYKNSGHRKSSKWPPPMMAVIMAISTEMRYKLFFMLGFIIFIISSLSVDFPQGSGYFAGPGKIAPRSYFAGPGKIVPRSYFAGPGKIAILDL